jgi:S-adenosylmethionine hydrolase
MPSSTIALVTDFGINDPYVGIMKGVIFSITPGVTLIDLTHQILPGDIQRGAFVLWQSAKDFPQNTIFLGVVDPGVGTDRKGICLKCRDQFFIGPDNGLFSYVILGKGYQAWELANPDLQLQKRGNTFHGRDIFAPAAAHLAHGISSQEFGKPISGLHTLPTPRLKCSGNKLEGEILSVDRFGNLFTSLGVFVYKDNGLNLKSWINPVEVFIPDLSKVNIMIDNNNLAIVKTFGNIPIGASAGVIGSTGLLEIVSNQVPADQLLGVKIGDLVHLEW